MNDGSGTIVTNQIATITISYDLSDTYVSRSCGFKVNFENLVLIHDNTWISSITPINASTIDDQTQAHVQIFH